MKEPEAPPQQRRWTPPRPDPPRKTWIVGGAIPLMISIQLWKATPMFRLLLERGGDPMRVDAEGRAALMYAVEKQNPEVATLMLSKGVPVNARDKAGTTALGQAKEHNVQKEIVEMLQRAGGIE